MNFVKLFSLVYLLSILLNQSHVQAGEHAQVTVDAKKWAALAGIGILSGLALSMLYDYYFGKQKPNKTSQIISNVRGKNVSIKQIVSGVHGKEVSITQNSTGSKATQTISMGNEIMNVNGYIVPPVGTDTNLTQENDIFYINNEKADFIESSGENICKQFFVNNYSAINIPSNLISVARNVNYIAENQVEIEIDKAFANDVEIQNENGTLKLNFIPRFPPRGYYVGDNAIAKITSIKRNINIRNTRNITTVQQSIN